MSAHLYVESYYASIELLALKKLTYTRRKLITSCQLNFVRGENAEQRQTVEAATKEVKVLEREECESDQAYNTF